MKKPEIIVSIGAEGGSITLLGRLDTDGEWQFARSLNDQTPAFLDEEDGGPAINHKSPWVATWPAALELLDEYPWVTLFGMEVHPHFRNQVWEEVERRLSIVPEQYAEHYRQQWAHACGVSMVDDPSS